MNVPGGRDVGLHVVERWGDPPAADVVSRLNNLVQAYALLSDHGRAPELAALFTDDAEWDGVDLGFDSATGPLSIAQRVIEHFRESEPMMHMTGPALLTSVTDTEVHGVACMAESTSPNTMQRARTALVVGRPVNCLSDFP